MTGRQVVQLVVVLVEVEEQVHLRQVAPAVVRRLPRALAHLGVVHELPVVVDHRLLPTSAMEADRRRPRCVPRLRVGGQAQPAASRLANNGEWDGLRSARNGGVVARIRGHFFATTM